MSMFRHPTWLLWALGVLVKCFFNRTTIPDKHNHFPTVKYQFSANFIRKNHENHQIHVRKSNKNHQKSMEIQWKRFLPIWKFLTRLRFFFRSRIECFLNGTFTTVRRDPACTPRNKIRTKNLNIFYSWEHFLKKSVYSMTIYRFFQKMLPRIKNYWDFSSEIYFQEYTLDPSGL